MKAGSRLEKVLAAGHFAVCGEMGPPRSADAKAIRDKAQYFRGYVDAVNVTDNQTAVVRVSSIASCLILQEEGVEPVVQMTCRDRNRLAIQSDLLGAAALGLKNVLCLTGDHQSFGDHPTAKNVHDIDSIQLIWGVDQMRKGRFMGGDEIKVPPRFFIGGAANPFGDPFAMRVPRLAKKIKAGCDFIQTQVVFDVPRFARWMELVRERGLHREVYIMAGVLPTRSVRALRYMQQDVAGVSIPDECIQRMEKAADPAEEGVKMAVELIQQLKEIEGVAGVHLMPVMWERIIPRLVEEAGLYPRPVVDDD
ncbi:MAG: methylenetetrahydrofolate reductase [Limnochordia bacterium]|jgi:5,10-methylenetetrahydrofolate reductase